MDFFRKKTDRQLANESASNACQRFWGMSNGAPGDLLATEGILRECKLDPGEIADLRAGLPLGAAGTTGARVARIDRVLKRLEKEA